MPNYLHVWGLLNSPNLHDCTKVSTIQHLIICRHEFFVKGNKKCPSVYTIFLKICGTGIALLFDKEICPRKSLF